MKYLLVGDIHAVVDELDDCQRLFDLIQETITKHQIKEVVFLGDQHHNHALVRVEVMDFWLHRLLKIHQLGANVTMLVGNHDRPNDASSRAHSLVAYEKTYLSAYNSNVPTTVVVAENGYVDENGVLFMGYNPNREAFVERVNYCVEAHQPKTLVCHQTFNGATYENGFYAPDGVDADLLNIKQVISGHIHNHQNLGKVSYLGSPRWRTVGDANTKKHIGVYTLTDDGFVLDELVPTHWHCTPIETHHFTPANPFLDRLEPYWTWSESVKHVTVSGPLEFVKEQSLRLESVRGIRLRTVVNEKQILVRESEGIPRALERFLTGFQGRGGTSGTLLWEKAKERLYGR